MNKYSSIYRCIEQNKEHLLKILKIVNCNKLPLWLRYIYANRALRFATYCHTGYFYLNSLEKFFVYIAQKYNIKNYNVKHKPKTVLHVLTKAYNSGGHTRVVERWIDNTKDLYQNSVVLLKQGKDAIPQLLLDNAKASNGDIFIFPKYLTKIQRALKLREIALNYEYIVLHTHMPDPIATIAFGTEKFPRPVLFFNHADHMFWIGKTISDVVLDIRTYKSISKSYRNIKNTKFCPIPCDFSRNTYISREEARNILNLDQNQKYIMTSGSSFKYKPVCGDGIFDTIIDILDANKNLNLIVIGADNENWSKIHSLFSSRVFLNSVMPYENYLKYVSAVDVILDSYPMNGEATLIDAMKAQTPFISLDTICSGQSDFVIKSKGYCRTKEEVVKKIHDIFNSREARKSLLEDELFYFEKEYSIENWTKNILNIYADLPHRHMLNQISDEEAPCFIDDYGAILECLYKEGC